MKNISLLFAVVVWTVEMAAAPFEVSVSENHAGSLYHVGEKVRFSLIARDLATDAAASGGVVSVTMDNFGDKVFLRKDWKPSEEPMIVLEGSLDEPGFLRVKAMSHPRPAGALWGLGKGNVCWAVGVEPERIKAGSSRPADFDAYWDGERVRLEREVPLDMRRNKVEEMCDGSFDVWRLSCATFNGKRVWGFLIVPKTVSEGPLPLHVNVPGAGPALSEAGTKLFKKPGEIHLVLNVHPYEPAKDHAGQKKLYEEQDRECARKYGSNYAIAGGAVSREEFFFHDALLGIDRAVAWAAGLPEVDREKVVYSGGSQGGGIGIMLCALNPAIRRACFYVPALTDLCGFKAGRQSGWPLLVERQKSDAAKGVASFLAPYFDAAHFAPRVKVPVRVAVGFSDTTCPPPCVYAAYNALGSVDKSIRNAPGMGHGVFPEVRRDLEDWLSGVRKSNVPQAHGAAGGKSFSITCVAGVPRITVDGVPYVGMCALPEPRLGPDAATFSMKDFSSLGVRFFSDIWWAKTKHNDWWLGEERYDFEAFDRRAKGLLDASPDGWIFPRLKMDPPEWWSKRFPDEMRAGEARPDSEAWRNLYRRMLEDVVRHVESSPYADRVMGYHVGALHGSEWLVWPWPKEEEPPVDWDAHDPLPPLAVTTARRAYIRKRNKDIADALLDSAAVVKRITGRKKLVGAFFGYMGNADHEDTARVMRSPDIDFLASPGGYGHRRAGQSGRFQLAWPSSCRLHGKLYWDEADIRTYHAKTKANYRCATPEESVGAIKRNLGYALTGGWEVWWFLLAGNDTFHDEQMLAPIRTAYAEERATLTSVPWRPADVAVFTAPDEYSTSTASVRGIPIRLQCKVNFHYLTMPYTGVAYDSYLLSDIEDPRLPDYKVYVFPNAFTLSEERRAAIKKVVRRAGKTAIWLYAPGYYRNGEGSAANIEDLTGVRVKENYPSEGEPMSRTFTAEGDGTCSVDGWRSVYLRVPLAVDELRKALADAGAHMWTDTCEVVAAGRGYLMVHAATDGRKTIRLPKRSDVSEIYGALAPLKGVESFEDVFAKGETKIYRLAEISE